MPGLKYQYPETGELFNIAAPPTIHPTPTKQDETMRAAAYVATQKDPLGVPELQYWFFNPADEDVDYQDPGRAWFKSEHTGAGSCSPYFTGDTDDEVEEKARRWRVGLSTEEEVRLRFKEPA